MQRLKAVHIVLKAVHIVLKASSAETRRGQPGSIWGQRAPPNHDMILQGVHGVEAQVKFESKVWKRFITL
jgi:hypothetical protein